MNTTPIDIATTRLLKQPASLTDTQFHKIANYIESNVGIKMPATKQIMVQSRLIPRLKALNFDNFNDYINYVFSADNNELLLMISAITTNLTQFFRESQHFDFLAQHALPSLHSSGIQQPEIWSAGCSSGEEAYTLSVVMQEYQRTHSGHFSGFSILATDISSKVLDKAVTAIYPEDSIAALPFELKHRYFLKSKNQENPCIRVNADTRNTVSFARLNFMDDDYTIAKSKHIIFCRNVIIYFDKKTQEAVVRKLVHHLSPGGFLFLGHSETILGMNLPLKNIAPTVFCKIEKSGV
jgi:chemotaxis protein methyltransferase CheR